MKYFFNFNINNSLPESCWIEDPSELPKLWRILTAATYNLLYLSIVGYFLYDVYTSGREKTFISLDSEAG